jgi:hypothetical protein
MKKILLFASLLMANIGFSQATQNVEWGYALTGGLSYSKDITTDANGNVFVLGTFNGSTDFDPSANDFILTSAVSTEEVFLAKYNANGVFLWAKTFGPKASYFVDNNYPSVFPTVETDASGNVYLAGSFRGTVDFDPSATVFNVSSSASNDFDAFVLKLDATGSFVWHRRIAGSGTTWLKDFKIRGTTLYILTDFTGVNAFDPAGTEISVAGEAAVVRWNTSGNYLSVSFIDATYSLRSNNIEVSAQGDMYVDGYFSGMIYDGVNPQVGSGVNSVGAEDIFVLKFSSTATMSSSPFWVKTIGNNASNKPACFTIDNNQNLILGISFSTGTIDLDPGTAVVNYTLSAGNTSVFVKLSSSGDYVWSNQLESTNGGTSYPFDIQTDSDNNIYALGFVMVNSTVDYDFGATNQLITTSRERYVLKMNENAGFNWVFFVDKGEVFHVDSDAKVYVSSFLYPGTAQFGSVNTPFELTSTTDGSAHFVKYRQCDVSNQITSNNVTLTATQTGATYQWLECLNSTTPSSAITGAISQSYTPTISGYYACEINLGGCVVTSTCEYIGVCPLSNAVTLTGNTITVNTIPQDPYFYWISGCEIDSLLGEADLANTIAEGATLSSFTPTVSGNYAVFILSNWEECAVFSECIAVSIAGINENEFSTFDIFPNPAKEQVTISNIEAGSTVTLVDVTGKTVSQQLSNSTSVNLQTSALTSGVYFVRVINNNGISGTQKLVIE